MCAPLTAPVPLAPLPAPPAGELVFVLNASVYRRPSYPPGTPSSGGGSCPAGQHTGMPLEARENRSRPERESPALCLQKSASTAHVAQPAARALSARPPARWRAPPQGT